jgi:hypothetical protein
MTEHEAGKPRGLEKVYRLIEADPERKRTAEVAQQVLA